MKTKKQIKKKIKKIKHLQEILCLATNGLTFSSRFECKINAKLEEAERSVNLLKWVIK